MLTHEMSDDQLDEIVNAFYDNRIVIDLWIWLTDLKLRREFIICWGQYKGERVHFQQRDDWGLIYGSIEIEKEE